MSKAISRRDFMKVTGAVGAAGLLAACGGNSAASSSAASTASSAPAASADESLALSDGPVSMTISWWGGDSRHEAYQNAIKEFQAEHTNITIEPHLRRMVRLGREDGSCLHRWQRTGCVPGELELAVQLFC